MAEPGVDLDLHHLHRAWHAGADHDVVAVRRIIQQNIVPMKPASFSGERIPRTCGLPSSGRTADTARSGDAAINSRQGALEPGIGGRFEFWTISALSF